MSDFKIAIVGAGLSGSLLANGLQQAASDINVDFTVYEADPRGSTREDYQLRLGAPALAGFKQCLTPAQLEKLYPMFGRSGGMVSSAAILYDTTLHPLLDLTQFPAYTKTAPISRVALRNFLTRPLADAGKVRWQKRFTGFEVVQRAQRRKVRLLFDDGTEAECDLLISAEGNRSKVNRQIGLDNIVQLKDKWMFLAKANVSPSKLLSLTPEVQNGPLTIIKDGINLFFSAFVPPECKQQQGQAGNQDADIASVSWNISVPSESLPKGGVDTLSSKLDFCVDLIREWDPRIHELLRTVSEEDIHVQEPRASTLPPDNWRVNVKKTYNAKFGSERVWMIGDAMHPMLPARDMGGNQALRDSVDALPVILDLARKAKASGLTEDDFVAATKEFESVMVPRAFDMVKASGGTSQTVGEPMTAIGRVMLFFAARALQVFSLARGWLGYQVAPDDAPEFRD